MMYCRWLIKAFNFPTYPFMYCLIHMAMHLHFIFEQQVIRGLGMGVGGWSVQPKGIDFFIALPFFLFCSLSYWWLGHCKTVSVISTKGLGCCWAACEILSETTCLFIASELKRFMAGAHNQYSNQGIKPAFSLAHSCFPYKTCSVLKSHGVTWTWIVTYMAEVVRLIEVLPFSIHKVIRLGFI